MSLGNAMNPVQPGLFGASAAGSPSERGSFSSIPDRRVPLILQALKMNAAKIEQDDRFENTHDSISIDLSFLDKWTIKEIMMATDNQCFDLVLQYLTRVNEYQAKFSGHKKTCIACDKE